MNECGSFNRTPRSSSGARAVRVFVKRYAVILCPALLFLVMVLAMNWQLFVIPLAGDGDLAVNAMQVQEAKHFHVLLGNYSRWHFHHPGPFLFYLFAAGETLFYDWLHIVPAPLNAEYLTEIAFSTACLFLAIYIFYVNGRHRLFPPLAVLASVLFLYAVDTAQPSAALVSVWPPFAGLFCFLLFAAACASLAAGNWRHLPVLAGSGMVMIHIHVAQLLFVTVLTLAALGAAVAPLLKQGKTSAILISHKAYFWASLGIVALFSAPILIDWISHHPNNITAIRTYLKQHRGEHQSFLSVLLYTFSFFSYFVRPELITDKPGASFSDLLNGEFFVHFYWSVVGSVFLFVAITCFRQLRTMSLFLKYAFLEIALILVLFLYWAWRITGGMYMMNGFFFFSVQLLGLFGLCALLSGRVRFLISRRTQIGLACAFTTPLLLAGGITNAYHGNADVPLIVSALRQKDVRNAAIVVPMNEDVWPVTAGVVRYMQRSHMGFCFGPEWLFMFGANHICKNTDEDHRVSVTTTPPACKTPCSVIYSRPGLCVTATPQPGFLTLPATITPDDSMHLASGFNVLEGGRIWSKKESALQFFLASKHDGAKVYKLNLNGTSLPGRPVTVKLNDIIVGTITQPGRSDQAFVIDPKYLIWNGANTITLIVPNAGKIGGDDRDLGYYFESLTLRTG